MDVLIKNAIVTGVFATIVLDVWQRVLHAAAGVPPTNWRMVGRWFAHLPRGTFIHRPIADAEPVANELAIGWLAHYVVGIAYSYLYALLITFTGISLSLLSAIAFGVITVVAAWFVLQPGLGVGVFARLAPNPWLIRALNLSAHVFFGCGLYLGWVIVASTLPPLT